MVHISYIFPWWVVLIWPGVLIFGFTVYLLYLLRQKISECADRKGRGK